MNPIARRILIKTFPKYALWWAAVDSLLRYDDSYLHSTGWLRSLKEVKPVDEEGHEVPWMCYPVIKFLEARLQKGFELFEFGSGYSTVFYARLAKSVTSVESSEEWIQFVERIVPANVRLIYKEKDIAGEYCRAVKSTGREYDVVIVDGRDRVNCVKQSIDALTPTGVIILDDSEREYYMEGIHYAEGRGFRALDFEGLKPVEPDVARTTILYRSNNCFGI